MDYEDKNTQIQQQTNDTPPTHNTEIVQRGDNTPIEKRIITIIKK